MTPPRTTRLRRRARKRRRRHLPCCVFRPPTGGPAPPRQRESSLASGRSSLGRGPARTSQPSIAMICVACRRSRSGTGTRASSAIRRSRAGGGTMAASSARRCPSTVCMGNRPASAPFGHDSWRGSLPFGRSRVATFIAARLASTCRCGAGGRAVMAVWPQLRWIAAGRAIACANRGDCVRSDRWCRSPSGTHSVAPWRLRAPCRAGVRTPPGSSASGPPTRPTMSVRPESPASIMSVPSPRGGPTPAPSGRVMSIAGVPMVSARSGSSRPRRVEKRVNLARPSRWRSARSLRSPSWPSRMIPRASSPILRAPGARRELCIVGATTTTVGWASIPPPRVTGSRSPSTPPASRGRHAFPTSLLSRRSPMVAYTHVASRWTGERSAGGPPRTGSSAFVRPPAEQGTRLDALSHRGRQRDFSSVLKKAVVRQLGGQLLLFHPPARSEGGVSALGCGRESCAHRWRSDGDRCCSGRHGASRCDRGTL